MEIQNLHPFIQALWDQVTFEMFIKFLILYFFIIWIAILAWVIRDISNRTDSLFLQVISVLIILLFTPLGVFIYLLIRPGKTLFEKYYEEIEDNLAIFTKIMEDKISEDERKHYEKKHKKKKKKKDN